MTSSINPDSSNFSVCASCTVRCWVVFSKDCCSSVIDMLPYFPSASPALTCTDPSVVSPGVSWVVRSWVVFSGDSCSGSWILSISGMNSFPYFVFNSPAPISNDLSSSIPPAVSYLRPSVVLPCDLLFESSCSVLMRSSKSGIISSFPYDPFGNSVMVSSFP